MSSSKVNQTGSTREKSPKSSRILVVDDESKVARGFQKVLQAKGFTVDMTTDVNHAIEVAKNTEFALFAVDWKMPGKNGFELMQELVKVQPNSSYLLVSAYLHGPVTAIPTLRTNTYLVSKPWDPDELVRVVEEAISGYHSRLEEESRIDQSALQEVSAPASKR